MRPCGGPQGVRQSVARLARQSDPAGAEDDRGHENVKGIKASRLQEGRERMRPALHQDAGQAKGGEGLQHGGGLEGARPLHGYDFHPLGDGRSDSGPAQDDASRAVGREAAGGRIGAAGGVDDDPRRALSRHAADREQRVVGDDGADPHHHGVHAGAQGMQVVEGVRTVDIFGFAGGRRDPPVQGLAELGHHEEPFALVNRMIYRHFRGGGRLMRRPAPGRVIHRFSPAVEMEHVEQERHTLWFVTTLLRLWIFSGALRRRLCL